MIAHTIDMKYPKKSEKLLHGQVIAVTSLTSAFLQEYLLDVLSRHENEVTLESVFLYQKNIDGFSPLLHGEVKKFFKSEIASACLKEYEEKYLLMKKAKKLNQKDIKELQKIHLSASKLREIFSHFKIKFSVKSLGLLDEEYQDCVAMAKFTRKRFTCLDLAIKNVA
jgi:glycerol dehydrogenase-like iron-containing ADH family enzyme